MRHHLDGYLSATDRKRLLSTMVDTGGLAEGKELCMQGVPGSSFFIVTAGTADVYVDNLKVRTLTAGSCCGEISAMGLASTRTATVRATSDLKAVCARAKVFAIFFGERVQAKRREWRPILAEQRLGASLGPSASSAPLGRHLDGYGLELLADVLTTAEFADGAWLSRRGETAGAFGAAWDGRVYLVLDGAVVDEQQQRVLCRAGDAFGQLEVLRGLPAQHGRRARGKLRCAVLEAEDFKRLVPREAVETPPSEAELKPPPEPPPRPRPPPEPLAHYADLWTTEQMLDGLGTPRAEAATPPPAPAMTPALPAAATAAASAPALAARAEPPPPRLAATRSREPGLLCPRDVEAEKSAGARVAEYERMLERVPVLQALSRPQRQRLLDALDEVSVAEGATIVSEGKASEHLYLVVSGRVTLSKQGEGELGTRKAGDYFGERALQSTGPALATAVAASACVLARVERGALDRLLGQAALQAWSHTLSAAKTARGVARSSWRNSTRNMLKQRSASVDAAEKHAPADFVRAEQGVSLRDFTVTKKAIGTGGFGKVYGCCHAPSGALYALKAIEKRTAAAAGQAAQVVSESATLEMLLHPFVANKFAALQTPSHALLVLEFCAGGDFFDVLRKEERFKPPVARLALCQLLLAVESLHALGVVHRDIKPENLMIDEHGRLKLTDFGFAKVVRFRTFTLCGTPAYMAPEIVLQRGHGKPVDFWAMGVLLYELLQGKSPFEAPTANASYQLILKNEVDYPDDMPPDAADLIQGLMQKFLSKRFGNMKGGTQDIKGHAWCKGLDWENAHQYRIREDVRAFERGRHEWLPITSVITTRDPLGPLEASKQNQFDGF